MQRSSEEISSSNFLGPLSPLIPESGGNAVIDESRDSSVLDCLEIPSEVTNEISNGQWNFLSRSGVRHASSDVSLFSTSLPVFPHEKLNLNCTEDAGQSVDNISCSLSKFDPDSEVNGVVEDVECHGIGTLLPDDEDELLSGVMDGFHIGLPNQMDDLEDYDVFGSGGGMEIESGQHEGSRNGISKISLSEDGVGNGQYVLPNGVGTVPGEHPYGEHPSRTLFVRNINSNVEDSELRVLFEQYGDIRTLYTTCKHRGFVMISYYDIRDARNAMRALQNKPLRRRKLDIHFSIPKDNPSDKDLNQGTLVVFNLDPSVSNDDLRIIFGAYGEVKEIRETPHKRHHKFIEFYDVRAAEAALRSLNRSDIAGKRIKLEPSRPGGARRNLMVHQTQDLEQDESVNFRHQLGFSIVSSPPASWPGYGSPIEHMTLQTLGNPSGFGSMRPTMGNKLSGLDSVLHGSPVDHKIQQALGNPSGFGPLSPTMGNKLSGLDSVLHPRVSNSSRIAPIGNGRVSELEHKFTDLNFNCGSAFQQSHSFPEPKMNHISGPISSFGVSTSRGSGLETPSGSQFLWGCPGPYQQRSNSSPWKTPLEGHPFTSKGQIQGLPTASQYGSLVGSSHHLSHHHVGSVSSGVSVENHFGFLKESSERSFVNPVGFQGLGIGHNETNFLFNGGDRITSQMPENGSPGFRMRSSSRLSPVFLDNGYYPALGPTGLEGFELGWGQCVENSVSQQESKKHFQLDLEKIRNGEDTRTTIMIKNIPNKYTSKMLMASIDENYRGTYDFLYLPIDFKNKCNVGYAFINMVSPSHVIPFYEVFNGKKWEKFNSEKVASLAYARIQGKAALVAHFQNSSLMNEDKRCRPIVFHSEGSEAGDLGHLPSSALNVQVHQTNVEDSKGSTGTSPHQKPNNS